MKPVIIIAIAFVLIVGVSVTSISAQSQYDIPSWVKGIAGFWAEDKITDSEFGEGLSFLIDNEIIKIPLIQELQNENSQLKTENSELRDKLDLLTPEPEPQISISAKTDLHIIGNGEVFNLSGTVSPFVEDKGLTYIIKSPDNETVTIGQIIPNSDGSFEKTIVAGGALWKLHGDYIIRLAYVYTTTEIIINYVGGEFVGCDPSYPDVCIAPYPPDLNCGDIGYSNFIVIGDDPHGFDRDDDGIGCES